MEQQRLEGIVWSLGLMGRGFIRPPGKKDHIFFLADAPQDLSKGRSVTFLSVDTPKGPKAVDIQLMEVA